MDIWHRSNKRVSSFTLTGCETSTTADPCAPIILCGTSDVVAELIKQHLQVQVSSPPPASRMHLSGGVAGQRATTRLNPVMCGVPLCVKTRWPEGSEGKWWRKASTGAQGQVIFAKGYQRPSTLELLTPAKDKKALHLNYHCSYNYFKAQLCSHWHC